MEFWNHSHRVSNGLCTLSPLPSHEGECYYWVLFEHCGVLITAILVAFLNQLVSVKFHMGRTHFDL